MTTAFQTLLVPLDGSALAEQALPAATAIARASGATLRLMHVFVPYAPRMDMPGMISQHTEIERELQEQAREYLRSVAEGLDAELPGRVRWDVARARPIQSPFGDTVAVVEAVRRFALRARPDLIVMATHARGGASRAWLGSVADALVRRVASPMLLVHPREGAAPGMRLFRHILVPLDGSALAEQSIPMAAALAALGGARLTLLRVVVPQRAIARPAPVTRVNAANLAREDADARQYLARTRERLAAEAPCIETATVVSDHPARAILEWAAEHEVDLVAMSTHGLSGVKRFMLGSVADKVVRGGPVPVLLTRPLEPAA